VFLLKDTPVSLAPETKILKAKDLGAFSEVAKATYELEALKEKFRLEKEKLLADIQKNAEELYEQRKKEGYLDGLLEGKEEESMKIMDTVMASLSYLEKLEGDLVNLVTDSVQKILGEIDQQELIRRIVKKALNTIRGDRRVIIRVAPSNEETVRKELFVMLASKEDSRGFVELRADSRLGPTDCFLESELGNVNASLNTQLKNLKKAFETLIKS
jgi:type III secretion protein L